MSGVLTMASDVAAATTAAGEVYRPEGTATLMIVAFMVAMGLVMGLVFTTKIAKEWSR